MVSDLAELGLRIDDVREWVCVVLKVHIFLG